MAANKFPKFKKHAKMFLTSKEAKMTKKKAIYSGITVMAAFFAFSSVKEAIAQHTEHVNCHIDNSGPTGAHHSQPHTSHSSHGSHGSHGQW